MICMRDAGMRDSSGWVGDDCNLFWCAVSVKRSVLTVDVRDTVPHFNWTHFEFIQIQVKI